MLQERHAEGGRAEVHSGAHMIVLELCYVAYVCLLVLYPDSCTLPIMCDVVFCVARTVPLSHH